MIDPTFTQSDMVIDYVRVYQNSTLSVEHQSIDQVRLYPNPSSDIVFINSKRRVDQVVIYDALGKKVLDEQGSGMTQVAIHHLQPGLYFVQCHSEGTIYNEKLMVASH